MEYEQDNSGHPDFGYPASSTHSSKDDASVNESKGSNVAMVTGDVPSMAKTPDKRRLESTDETDDAVDELADRIPGLASKPVKVDSRMARDLNNPFKRQSSVVQESQDMTGGAFDNVGKCIPESKPQSGNFSSAQAEKIFIDSALHQETATTPTKRHSTRRNGSEHELPELKVNPDCHIQQQQQPLGRIEGLEKLQRYETRSVHSVPDIYGEDKIYLIKNQLLFDEEKLLIYPVFWIGDTKDTSNIKHHSKSCVVKVAARHTDTLHFTIVASSEHEEYLLRQPIERRFKLNYFACDPCKSFQFRVTPTPDKVSSKYIDIDYYMRVESMESQEIYDRFKNLDKHDGATQFHEQTKDGKASKHCNGSFINPSIHIHQHYGDSTRTLTGRTVVENGGKYDEKAYGNTATTIKPG